MHSIKTWVPHTCNQSMHNPKNIHFLYDYFTLNIFYYEGEVKSEVINCAGSQAVTSKELVWINIYSYQKVTDWLEPLNCRCTQLHCDTTRPIIYEEPVYNVGANFSNSVELNTLKFFSGRPTMLWPHSRPCFGFQSFLFASFKKFVLYFAFVHVA